MGPENSTCGNWSNCLSLCSVSLLLRTGEEDTGHTPGRRNMATLSNALTYARQLAQTDSNGISDTLGMAFANDALQNMTRSLIERGIDAAQVGEAFTTLTTSDTPVGQFEWPDGMFALKTVEVDYSGSGGQNYLQAQALDVANIQFASWDYLRANQPTNMPLYDNRGDTGEVFPSPLSSVLLRIFTSRLLLNLLQLLIRLLTRSLWTTEHCQHVSQLCMLFSYKKKKCMRYVRQSTSVGYVILF